MRSMVCLVFLIGMVTELIAMDNDPTPAPFDGPPVVFRFFDFSPDVDVWGGKGTITVGFRIIPELDTALWLHLGAAWSNTQNFFRLVDGSLYRSDLYPSIPSSRMDYQSITLPWGVGLQQGLHFDPIRDRNDLNVLLAWRGYWDWNLLQYNPDSLLATSDIPGRDWILTSLVQVDLNYDGVYTDHRSHVKNGWTLDASLEYSPLGWSVPASTNFLQLDLAAAGFLPLYESWSRDGLNLFSVYLGAYSSIDGLIGLGSDARQGIPYTASQKFGGLEHRDGLGGSVRGFGDGWGDGILKWVGNIELRFNLPALVDQEFYFGSLVFFDAGAWLDPPATPRSDALRSGFLMTSGVGVFVDIFGLGYIVAHSDFMLNQPNELGKYWKPFSLDFGLHF